MISDRRRQKLMGRRLFLLILRFDTAATIPSARAWGGREAPSRGEGRARQKLCFCMLGGLSMAWRVDVLYSAQVRGVVR